MNAAQVTHHRPAHHDVVEVAHHEISAVHVRVNGQRGQEKAGQPAHGEKADEAQRVKHGRLVGDRPFVKRGGPVEDLDGGGDGHQEAQHRKDNPGIDGLSGDEHVVSPNQE